MPVSLSSEKVFDFKKRPEFLRKPKKPSVPGMRRSREAVKFRPLDEDLSSSSDDEDLTAVEPSYPGLPRPLSSASTRSDTVINDDGSRLTSVNSHVFDVEAEKAKLGRARNRMAEHAEHDTPGYSDFEEDVTVSAQPEDSASRNGQWSPAFLRRHSQVSTQSHQSRRMASPPASRERRSPDAPILPYAPAPATPSLIRAVQRISQAQHDAFGPLMSPVAPAHSTPAAVGGLPAPDPSPRWDMFWREVRAKAEHPSAS